MRASSTLRASGATGTKTKRPGQSPAEPDGWIPPGKEDVLSDKIDGVNRDPKSPDFLRPTRIPR